MNVQRLTDFWHMAEVNLYLYGDIYNRQRADAHQLGFVSLTSLVSAYKGQQGDKASSVVVHIHSNGGEVDEGYAIYNWLRSLGKPITTVIEGVCRSIATVIAMAGDDRQMYSHSDFRIHNPWGVAMGTADEVQDYADELRAEEEKLRNFYASHTKADESLLKALMDEDKPISPEQALELGFITKIINASKAVAFFTPKKQQNMSAILNSINKKFDVLLRTIRGESAKALFLTTNNGVTLEVVSDADQPAVGDLVLVDGQPAAAGEYVLQDGSVLVINAEGRIESINNAGEGVANMMEVATKLDATVSALAAERQQLIDRIAKMEQQLKEQQEALLDVGNKFATLASAVRSTYKVKEREPVFGSQPTEVDKIAALKDKAPKVRYNFMTGNYELV